MSETVTDPIQDAPEPSAEVIVDPQVTETETTQTEPTEPVQTEDQPAPKPRRADRHVAALTARVAEKTAALEAAERRAEAAEALLRASKGEDDPEPKLQPAIDREAVRREIRFDEQRNALILAGQKEFGKGEWDGMADTLGGLGAVSNAAFMEALVDLPNAPKIVAALADDPDALIGLLAKSPAAMAAQLGRMDAKMETTPAPKPGLSNAPKPPPALRSQAVEPEHDIYNYPPGMSMKEWNALAEKALPRRLGGKRAD